MKFRKPSILVVNWCLSFFLSASTAATHILTAPNCTTTIISLEPCALNVEYQHFISYSDLLKCLYFQIPLKEGIGGERRPKDRVKRVYFTDNSNTLKVLTHVHLYTGVFFYDFHRKI
jgi:hypothetical protein